MKENKIMEHITIKQLDGDYIRLTPDEGYLLYDKRTKNTYSVAEIHSKDKKYFKAIEVNNE